LSTRFENKKKSSVKIFFSSKNLLYVSPLLWQEVFDVFYIAEFESFERKEKRSKVFKLIKFFFKVNKNYSFLGTFFVFDFGVKFLNLM